jgi:hypothetical protein
LLTQGAAIIISFRVTRTGYRGNVAAPRKRRSLIGRNRRRVRRKGSGAPEDEIIEALEYDGVDWTGELDAHGVEIGLVDEDWDIPDDLEVVETTRDSSDHFQSEDRDDAAVWDEDSYDGEWDENTTGSGFDPFKALVESEADARRQKNADARGGPKPESANNNVKFAIAGVVGLLLITGFGAFGLVGVGVGAVVAGASGSPEEANVVIEEPVPEAEPIAPEVDDTDAVLDEEEDEEPEEAAQPRPRRRAPVAAEEPEPEPIAAAPDTPEPEVAPTPTAAKKKKKIFGKKKK